jgi:hypothetical protein
MKLNRLWARHGALRVLCGSLVGSPATKSI